MIFKILFHRHLSGVATKTLWRWMKGLAALAAVLWAVPDCIPFVDEAVVTWMTLSALLELGARGEINSAWLPEGLRKRFPSRHGVIDAESNSGDP